MNGILAIYFCVLGLFCSPVDSFIDARGGQVTDLYPGATQEVVKDMGTILTAHVGKVGSWFYYVFPGDEIRVWYADGTHKDFLVTEQKWYEADGANVRNVDTGQVLSIAQAYRLDARHLMLWAEAESPEPVIVTASGVVQFDATWGRYVLVAVPAQFKGEK